MEVLEKVLEKNGIQIPKAPKAKSNSWLLWTLYKIRLKVFSHIWKEVIEQYSYLEQAVLRYYVEWYKGENEFLRHWDAELSDYLGQEEVELKFHTPYEGEQAIKEAAMKMAKATGNLPVAINSVENQLREKWIESIVKAAPEGCKLIVLKNPDYVNENLEAYFEREVRNRRPCHVQIEDSLYVYIAFSPQKIPSADTLYICEKKSALKYVK